MGTSSVGPEIFLIGTDHQIYYQQLNANGTPMAGASFHQSAPGGGLAIAVGTDSIGPEIFLIGTNQEIYYQQLNANGTPMAGASFQQTAAGAALAIAVTDPVVDAASNSLANNTPNQSELDAYFAGDPFGSS